MGTESEAGRRWSVARAAVAVLLATACFLLPTEWFGPDRPAVGWLTFTVVLGLITLLLMHQIRDVLVDRRDTRPALVIPLLMAASVLTFAATYSALARHTGEFVGLDTRLDAVYFTIVTLATVGYGDITPHGQTARFVAILQILYNFVFLTAAATALSQRIRRRVGERLGAPEARESPAREGEERHG